MVGDTASASTDGPARDAEPIGERQREVIASCVEHSLVGQFIGPNRLAAFHFAGGGGGFLGPFIIGIRMHWRGPLGPGSESDFLSHSSSPFNLSGVLPQFAGTNPVHKPTCSPYRVQATELVNRFATTPERTRLLIGLLDLRQALSKLGVTQGAQWIDGSFVENVEALRGRAPADIDVVTFAARPILDEAQWRQTVDQNQNLFYSQHTKTIFGCDHYFLDTRKRSELLIADTTYFFGLFSHQRLTSIWKGMLELPFSSDDQHARTLLLEA